MSRLHGVYVHFCVHDSAATCVLYLALSKAWHYLFMVIFSVFLGLPHQLRQPNIVHTSVRASVHLQRVFFRF